MKKNTSNKGFTLIELMVVILIIAILGALGLVSYRQATQSARDGRREADMQSVRQALILFRQENGGCFPNVSNYAGLGTPLNGTYISTMPADPGSNTYTYTRGTIVSGCVQTATLGFTLEGDGAQTIALP